MKKKLFFAAMALVALASCTSDEFVGVEIPQDNSPSESNAIVFSSASKGITRADIAGGEAAKLLGYNFYVTGTKGTEAETSPTPTLVFDNYLVHNQANTAGTTTSNTANWEYVGITPGTAPTADYIKLGAYQTGSGHSGQTIKYWDYSTEQYDFLAFSTGEYKPVLSDGTGNNSVASESAKTIGVTAMKYGTGLASSAIAYTFEIPSINALKNAYISDITEVTKTNYNKEVTLKFKNLGSKVRIALYETVPGYSVQAGSVRFYTVDNDAVKTGQDGYVEPTTAAALISENTSSFASTGYIKVFFPNVGTKYDTNGNYDKAAATVTAGDGVTNKSFGTLASDKYAADEFDETEGNLYLGRSLPNATFAGEKNADYYETVFPVSTGYPLTLRIDYTLVATDGSGETIKIYGAKAVVPSTYTKWQPNYAYTYIFKISDNTNGWTDDAKTAQGLFPITFDAVVAEATDATGEQTTVTTVATPTITTYQQGHTYATNEYDNGGKKLYVQVMDNNLSPAKLVGATGSSLYKLNTQTSDATPTDRSLLYLVNDADATEAKVMDALENRTTAITDANVTGRNSISLTKQASPTIINNAVTSIVNGVDDNPITVTAGEAAEIAIGSLAVGTYAYVYDYTAAAKTTRDIYQPIATKTTEAIGANGKFYVAASTLATYDVGIDNDATHYSTAGAPNAAYIYFSVTTNGTGTKTYSFVSVDGKDAIPAGLLAYPVGSLTAVSDNTANAAADTFYFDKYIRNNGKYAVKVIKVI